MKKRNIKITKQMTADAKTMLSLMGLPVIEAYSEAEAQCVLLVKAKKADAVASEDMDCLTFGAPLQLRGFTQRKSKNDPITEIELSMILKELDLTMDEFIDMCILCGCDYTKSIDGLGPSGAFKLIKEYKTIEKCLEALKEKNVEREKSGKPPMYIIPDGDRFNYEAARNEFKTCRAVPVEEIEITFKDPDEEGLKKFLCEDKSFSLGRVEGGLEKLKVSKKAGVQSTLEAFFGKPTKVINTTTKKGTKDKSKEPLKFSAKR